LASEKYVIRDQEHEKEQERKSLFDKDSFSEQGGLLDSSGKGRAIYLLFSPHTSLFNCFISLHIFYI
jgi:hypothetical protein